MSHLPADQVELGRVVVAWNQRGWQRVVPTVTVAPGTKLQGGHHEGNAKPVKPPPNEWVLPALLARLSLVQYTIVYDYMRVCVCTVRIASQVVERWFN